MATIKEVARMAGVSTATVSKYLNGVNLKERNRIAVQNAIETLDYKLNPTAQGLRKGKTMTIGVLLPELNNLFAMSIVSVIEDILIKKGYSTIICYYKSDKNQEFKKLHFLLNKMVDGIIAMPYYLKSEDFKNIKIPVVFVDRKPHEDCSCVLIDNKEASYEATQHFIKNGHSKIGILLGPRDVYTAKERYKGYCDAFTDNGIPLVERYVMSGEYDVMSGHDMTLELIRQKDCPTAIFATNYELTLGAVIALNEKNINIPDEISFIGFDNLELAQVVKPRITIVAQPVQQLGKEVARLILESIENNQRRKSMIELKANLIVQDSVKRI